MRRIALPSLAILALVLALASGADTPASDAEESTPAVAPAVESAGDAPAFADPLADDFAPIAVKKGPPSQEQCPGEFTISRPSSYYDCTLEACNQWCVEEGASYAASHAWIIPASGGICACTCCP